MARLDLPDPAHPTAGMVRIAGGRFSMGAAPVRPEEGPPTEVAVGPFLIDRTEVTNAAFARFVAATGYRTLAERGLDARAWPTLTADQRRPASLVFVGAKGARSDDPSQWWRVVPGADWRHPDGPGSSIEGKDAWPVVHVAWADAMAYARWLGRDLPTEAEWEYAARGGLAGKRYVWGDQPQDPKHPRANTWQGVFPAVDTGADGYKAQAAPVGCYAPNGYGLFDMAGNVWEWTKDWFRPGLEPAPALQAGGPPQARALDPAEPDRPKHVVKGGSYLCADDYCFRYRPAARTPGPPDSGAEHVGFRTVLRLAG
ncbi:MAG TPA: formylglycine-generating enzyme family protein [Caulobacteraceae bacterium]|nr:formylglycine-generating enzyme family protein [Caulobacteraceae bacterium]